MTRLSDTPLLDWTRSYPLAPGHKRPGTSQEAAAAMQPVAGTLRAACLYALKTYTAHPAIQELLTAADARPRGKK